MADKPRCKTCKFWGSVLGDGMDRYGVLNGRRCGHPLHGCAEIESAGDEDQSGLLMAQGIQPDDACSILGDHGHAAIFPGPDFGCIHHEPRGEDDPHLDAMEL